MGYTQLSERQRYQISHLLRIGQYQYEIAREVGVHPSTISREIRRNRSRSGFYDDLPAHQKARLRRYRPVARIKEETWTRVIAKLEEEWSPEQISGWLLRRREARVSPEWIYQYILRDKKRGGDLYRHLRCQKKRRKRYGSCNRRGVIAGRRCITERPGVVEKRTRIGDWELDTIVSGYRDQGLVTIVDRRSRYLIMTRVKKVNAEQVTDAILRLLEPYQKINHTLTSDNGKEFAFHKEIETKLHAMFYFAHPYSSWERGTNENTNGLVRQYIPKKRSLMTVEDVEIVSITDRLNHRPRKTLGFHSPHDIFFESVIALDT